VECGGPPPLSKEAARGRRTVHGKPPFGFFRMHWDQEPARQKRRRGGALQNLAGVRGTVADAPASWSAAALRRFRCEPVLGIRTVHGKQPQAVGGDHPRYGGCVK